MTAAAALSPLTPRLVPGRAAKPNERVSDSDTHDRHVEDVSEEFLPPLRPVTFPKIISYHQNALSDHGWSTITYDDTADALYEVSQALFKASQAFFNLPVAYKETFKTEIGSEEGWSRIEGEKELITLRCLESTPKELKDAAEAYWDQAGRMLDNILGRISQSLGLPAEALTQYSSPCTRFPIEKTATMLRLFRYEGFEGRQSKTVAEPHRDLGLLSLVSGDTPGLEVWDRYVQKWFQIERTYERPASSILVGRELERLSNGRYRAGGHLVRSYPNLPTLPEAQISAEPTKPERNYRFSIVFVLRAHSPIPVDTDALTTTITGKHEYPLKDITAQELFRNIQNAHFNINTQIQEREEQRRRLAEKKNSLQSASLTPSDHESDRAT